MEISAWRKQSRANQFPADRAFDLLGPPIECSSRYANQGDSATVLNTLAEVNSEEAQPPLPHRTPERSLARSLEIRHVFGGARSIGTPPITARWLVQLHRADPPARHLEPLAHPAVALEAYFKDFCRLHAAPWRCTRSSWPCDAPAAAAKRPANYLVPSPCTNCGQGSGLQAVVRPSLRLVHLIWFLRCILFLPLHALHFRF
jgi:hypothetical protein